MSRRKINITIGSLQLAMILFPCWIMLYYFKEKVAGWLFYNALHLTHSGNLTPTLVFFVSTLLKIFLLLLLIIFIMSLIRSWIPADRIRNRLRSMPPVPANILAGVFGIFTPFCSCSAVPLFIGFLETGVPLGITFTFLISAPLVNELILTMLAGLFGLKVALVYLLAGLSIAIVSGFVIDRLRLEKHLPEWLLSFRNDKPVNPSRIGLDERISNSIQSTLQVLSRTWLYIVLGIAIGAVIHGYVPDSLVENFLGRENWYSMPLAVFTGIPLYACSASVAPLAFALVDKGVPLGTAMAFMMAVAGLSLPEFIMLRRVLTTKLLLIFAGIVFSGIILMGYLFNWLF